MRTTRRDYFLGFQFCKTVEKRIHNDNENSPNVSQQGLIQYCKNSMELIESLETFLKYFLPQTCVITHSVPNSLLFPSSAFFKSASIASLWLCALLPPESPSGGGQRHTSASALRFASAANHASFSLSSLMLLSAFLCEGDGRCSLQRRMSLADKAHKAAVAHPSPPSIPSPPFPLPPST
jgi:hypothetical protein